MRENKQPVKHDIEPKRHLFHILQYVCTSMLGGPCIRIETLHDEDEYSRYISRKGISINCN